MEKIWHIIDVNGGIGGIIILLLCFVALIIWGQRPRRLNRVHQKNMSEKESGKKPGKEPLDFL